MKVSIVIPAYNEEDNIKVCLDSILIQGEKDVEIIVVDDASTDKTSKILKQYKGIKVITKKSNEKQAWAIYDGCRASTGEVIMVLGADSFISPDYIKRLKEWFKSKDVIALGGKLEPTDTDNKWMRSSYLLDNAQSNQRVSYNVHLAGSGLAVRRSVFEELNGYDTSCTWGQDRELNIRLQKYAKIHNKFCVYEPKLNIYTDFEGSFMQVLKRRFSWGRGRIFIYRKYKKFSIGDYYRLGFIPISLISLINPLLFAFWMSLPLGQILMKVKNLKKENIDFEDILYIIASGYGRLIGTSAGMLKEMIR